MRICRFLRLLGTILPLSGAPALVAADAPAELVLPRSFHLPSRAPVPGATAVPGLELATRNYRENNALEWQVRLQGPATGVSPLYTDLPSADFQIRLPAPGPVVLHWSQGSHAEAADFQPHTDTLSQDRPSHFESFGGRSSDGVLPYFNLAAPGGGLILAVGWSGDWQATFETLPDGKLHVTAGLKHTRFRLPAGEHVRLPSILIQSYRGDWLEGQNQFRRLLRQHFTPHNHAPMELMPVAASVHGMIGFNDTTETNLVTLVQDIAGLHLPIDTCWLDAGWNTGGFPRGQGNPQPDPTRFPRGLAPFAETAHAAGMRALVWFEPERVMRGTVLEQEHPEWLLKPTGTPKELRYQEADGFHVLDLGNPTARAAAIASVSAQIRTTGIEFYRQDFNAYPSFFWHTGETGDDVGLREIRYINGLYDYLDELTRRHPGLILDNCASGGRRLDFEMMRRSEVLWRSDSCWGLKEFPRNVQAMTHGLSLWLPLHGLGAAATDDIALRSGMGACASFAINYRDPTAVAALRRHLDRYLPIRAHFAADYYPLTPWSDDSTRWLAFQFHDPARNEGVLQAFRGAQPNPSELVLRARGLKPRQWYRVTDWDRPGWSRERTGADLMSTGITVSAATNTAQAAVLSYAPRTKR